MYCVRCKKKTKTTSDLQIVTTSNNRQMKRGSCAICGTTKMQFIKSSKAKPNQQRGKAKGGSILNKMINNLPVEMHLLGHNFTGPGTKLNKRLNADLTLRERMERGLVSTLIGTKKRFGWGIEKKKSSRR